MEEIELTYLARRLPEDLSSFPSKEMVDIYIPATSDHPVLRIRKRGDVCEITKKSPITDGDASVQKEETIPLTTEEYKEFSALPGKWLAKTRYFYKHGGVDFEIDVLKESLEGLVVVDVEFSSVADKDKFPMPDFCLAEITQETFIAGGMLAGKTYADIEGSLKKFGYQKITGF
ncbi:MAG: hypothetical protein AAB602_01090 [Patescibacteria group bacterium]